VDWIDSKKPDVIHLHNIHGDWLHLETLFKYIKKNKVAVVWTLHDCWAFTGRCSHFVSVNCEKWKTKCEKCINKSTYPISYFFDRSKEMYEDKKRLFMNIDNLTIVTPSVWLSKIVKKSFLCQYPIKVIPSGINTEIFLPKKEKSSIYSKIGDKHIILGVANSWTDSKGFNDFIRLDSILDHDRYQIVMVGLNKRQLKQIPKTIVGISKTTNQYQLAELYSGASCYLNCSKLETQGLTTVEALACGTPVVVYNKSAIPEVVGDGCGAVLDTTTPTDVKKVVEYICEESKNKSCMCREHVIEHYRSSDRFDDYLSLYISVGGIS
jgi:glycosyltransferase involved in cell wall biosynthesis